jgi:hypothetical protein
VQQGINAGQTLGQNALSAGQNTVQQGLSTGQTLGQNALTAGQDTVQQGINASQTLGQNALTAGQGALQQGIDVGTHAVGDSLSIAQMGSQGLQSMGTHVLQSTSQVAFNGATVAAAVIFNPVTAELVWIGSQLLAGVMRDICVAAGGQVYTTAKDMLKSLAESLSSVKEELLETMRIDKFKKLTNIQFAAYLEDKKKTLEAATKKIADGTVDSVVRLLPELDKDYFAVYITDPLKQKVSQAKNLFASSFTAFFKGVIQTSTEAYWRKFADTYQSFKGVVSEWKGALAGGVQHSINALQDVAAAGSGIVSQVGDVLNQSLQETHAALEAESQRVSVNPLTVPIAPTAPVQPVLPVEQQVVLVRDSSNMGVQTRQQVDSQTGLTQTVVARR